MLCALFARDAQAAPQASLGVEVGGGVTDLRTGGPHGAFVLGGRGDVLFLRSRDRDFAVGPYLDVGTEAFASLDLGGGVEVLIPAIPSVPFVLAAGGTARHTGPFGWEPGLSSSLFFGPRGYNFHSFYGMANGLFVEGRYGLGDGKQADVLFGARIDTMVLAMPFIFLYEAIAH